MLALFHCDITCRDFHHTDEDRRHQPNVVVVRLDEDNRTGGGLSDVPLPGALSPGVWSVWIGKALEKRLGEVGAIFDVGFDDLSTDWGVPAMVAQSTQEGLVDGAAGEVLAKLIMREHVRDRIRLTFDPESVAVLDVVSEVVWRRFASTGDDLVMIWCCNRANAFREAELAGEEIVP